jgi:phage terminase small subunit
VSPAAQKPPRHLKAATRKWWAGVVREFEFEEHHLKLLTLAAEAWDRCQDARAIIDRQGISYVDRFGAPRLRPEVNVERDSRIAFARILRELALDVSAPDSSRPPTITRGGR